MKQVDRATLLSRAPLLLAVLMALVSANEATAAGVLPVDRATVWSPGIPGGVPSRTTVCATLSASTYGNGASDASAGIQAALDACPAGQVVSLSAGTFLINNDYLLISKGVTLRGAGAGVTTLKRTNGAKPGSETASVSDPVVVIGPTRWPRPDDATSRNLTADGAKGSYSVTVASGSGFAAGQFVLLDEDNYNTATWQSLPNRNGQPTSVKIWASDRAVWQRHNPPADEDDPFPEANAWFSRAGRPISEIKEVASVAGSTVTFTTPLHISYRTARAAQLTRYTGSNVHVKNAGLENLTVYGGGDGNVRFECAAYSWMRNVEDTVWLGEGVAINDSFRVEVRESYVHDAAWPNPGGGGYAISFASGSAEALIENNVVMQANKVMVARSSGAGSVVGYNYMDDGHIGYNADWVEVGINGSHMVGPHHMLFEGNESFNYDSDNTHGNSIYQTVFRNHLSGFRRSYPGMGNARAGGLMYGSWWHSFVGNVMGTAGRMSGWIYEDAGTSWGDAPSIWKLGYDPIHWEQSPDPQVRSTVLREGNYDYVTNQVRWDTAAQTLPASLYLTGKPAFFGSLPWPWVDPTGTTKLYTLPAKARYDAGTPIPLPAASIDDPAVREGNAGVSALLAFTVSLSFPSSSALSVSFATADGTAKAGSDYTGGSGSVTFAPGQTTRSILVPILGNTAVEPNKTFFVRLTSTGVTIVKSQGTGTIVNDDPPSTPASTSQYRLYSPITHEHLYTTDSYEYSVLGTRGWVQEGVAYRLWRETGSYGGAYAIPFYRLYHPGVLQHHWTTDWYEAGVLASGAWTYEGIIGYLLPVQAAGTTPLYRLNLAQPPLHLWTTDSNEYQVLTGRGWTGEGVVGYVLP